MKPSRIRPLALLPLLLLGCDEQLEPGTKIDSFRVLAEQVDQPYAHPGEQVQLSTLSYDPEDRGVTWAWASCVNPTSSNLEGCLAKIAESDDPASSVFAMGLDVSAPQLTIPVDAISSLPAAARGSATVGVLSVACPGDLSMAEGQAGLPFRCQEVGSGRDLALDEFVVGLKRISVRETDRNLNPAIAGVTFDGSDWPDAEVKTVGFCDTGEFTYTDCSDDDKHELAVQLAPGSIEKGTDERGRAFDEQVVVQYYATEGIFENEVKLATQPKNGWVARKRASGQLLTLWFVVRDDRGGVSWTERRVQVR